MGVYQDRRLWGSFSITEARVLYELSVRSGMLAADIARELCVDQGYVSRIVQGFVRRGLVRRERSSEDGRAMLLHLTPAGFSELEPLAARARVQAGRILEGRSESEQRRMLDAIRTIEEIGSGTRRASGPCIVRRPHPGDLGWIVGEQGLRVKPRNAGRAEARAVQIVAEFLRRDDAARERCWVADCGGTNAGCAFVVARAPGSRVAEIRLFYVDPGLRDRGIGTAMLDECVAFAEEAGYRSVVARTERGDRYFVHLLRDAKFKVVRRGDVGDGPAITGRRKWRRTLTGARSV